jgi:hypothetical protein
MHVHGACKIACILKFAPVSLVSWRSLQKTPLVVMFLDVALSSLLMHALRMVNLSMLTGWLGRVCLTRG